MIIGKSKIKTRLRYHLTSIRMVIIEKMNKKVTNTGEDVEKVKILHSVVGNVN